MIRFTCQCGHRFVEPEDSTGLSVQCPRCKAINDIPQSSDPISVDENESDHDETSILIADAAPLDPPIPFATRTVNYADPNMPQFRSIWHVFFQLLQPINLFVMAFVVVAHLVAGFIAIPALLLLYFAVPVLMIIVMVIAAHYGNVVDEIGVDERDELPRVLRDFRFSEDFWRPIFSTAVTAIICYGPSALMMCCQLPLAAKVALGWMLAVIGTFFLPAILLTLLTSGSIANLRPDRVLGLIHGCGQRYRRLVTLFVIALIPYAWGIYALFIYSTGLHLPLDVPDWCTSPTIGMSCLLAGIFIMHAFCWQLGMLYRVNGPQFPWVGRYHASAQRPPIVRRKPRYVAPESMD